MADQYRDPIVPPNFDVPTELDHASFRLRPLGPEHNGRDHRAWESSIDHISATPGFPNGNWPSSMSSEENLSDLERHAQDFRERIGFTYTVLEPEGPADDADVIGCVYIYPKDDIIGVRSWVRTHRAELDAELATTVRAWLDGDVWPWPPEQIRDYPRPGA